MIISLKERLERLKKGRASDPDYVSSVIVSFANTSIYDHMTHYGYMSLQYEPERKRLRELLQITEEEEKKITYQEAAIKIKTTLTKQNAREATRLLAEPFIAYFDGKELAKGYCILPDD